MLAQTDNTPPTVERATIADAGPEIPRRTNVAGIFPNRAAVVRLVGAVQRHARRVGERACSIVIQRRAPPTRRGARR